MLITIQSLIDFIFAGCLQLVSYLLDTYASVIYVCSHGGFFNGPLVQDVSVFSLSSISNLRGVAYFLKKSIITKVGE